MKQLFFILSFFVAVSARAQLVNPPCTSCQGIGAPNTTLQIKGPIQGWNVLNNGNPSTVPMVYDTLTGRFYRRHLGIWFSNKFKTSRAGNVAYAFDSVDFADDVWDKINEVTTPGNYVPYPDFIDTTNNLRDAIAAVWANFSNYYTKTESEGLFVLSNDVRSITAADTTRWGAGAAPSADNPYRIDSSKVTGTTNKTITNYYHNGTTYSYSFVDLTALAVTQNNFNNYVVTATGTGSLQGEPDFQYDDVLNYLSLGGTVHPDFRLISTGYVNGMTSRIAPNVAGRIFGASKGGMNLQGYSDSLRYPGLRLQGYMSSTTGANVAPITMESFRPGTTYYRQKLAPTDTAFSMYSGARDSAGVLLMSMLGNGNVYFSGTVNSSTGPSAATLNDLTDVTIASPTTNQVLQYDGTDWKNKPSTTIDLTGVTAGDWIKATGATSFGRLPALSVTTTSTSGAASYNSTTNVLNIPNYSATSTGVTTTADNALSISGTAISTRKAFQTATDATTTTLNAATGMNWNWTIGGNRTLAVSNAQDGDIIAIYIIQDATGSRLVTWPSGTVWLNGAAPTLKTTGTDRITLQLNGTTWYGSY